MPKMFEVISVMATMELIELLRNNDVTSIEGYNLIISDMWDGRVTPEDFASPECQWLISYFRYKIEVVLLPVIRELRASQVKI